METFSKDGKLRRGLFTRVIFSWCITLGMFTNTLDKERKKNRQTKKMIGFTTSLSHSSHFNVQAVGLAKTILQGTVQGGRRRGRQRKRWEDNIKEWTGLEWNILLRKAENREEWRKLVVKSIMVRQRSARLRDR